MQEASQCNWKSLLALHIFLSFMAHCVKVIFLGQDDVDVKEPCSKQKGWDLTAAAEVLNCLTWRGLTTAGGYRRCRHSFPRCVSLPSYPLFGFLGFFLSTQENPLFQTAKSDMMEVFCTDVSPRWMGFSSGANFVLSRHGSCVCLGFREREQFSV